MNYFVRSSLKEFSVLGCDAHCSGDILDKGGITSQDIQTDATPKGRRTDHPSDAAHVTLDIQMRCGSTLGSESNAAEAQHLSDDQEVCGSAAKPPRPRAQHGDDIHTRIGSRPQTQRQADGSNL